MKLRLTLRALRGFRLGKTTLPVATAVLLFLVPAALHAQSTATLNASGDWNGSPGIWSGGIAPNNGNNGVNWNATVNANTVTVDAATIIQGLTLSGGTISAANDLTVNSGLNMSGGALSTVAATLLKGASSFTNGTISGTGTVTFDTGSTLTLSNAGTISQTQVTNKGTASRSVIGHGTLFLQNGGVFENASGAVFTNSGSNGANYNINGNGTSGVFNNIGTLNNSGVSNNFLFTNGAAFNNTSTGAVNVNVGMVQADSGGISTGTFTIASGAVFRVGGGNYTMEAGVRVNGAGNFEMTGGTTTFEGANGTSNGSLSVAGGTATFDTGATFSTAGKLTMTSGTLNGGGNATFGGTGSSFTSGTMSGPGMTTFSDTSSLTINAGIIDGRTLTVEGSASRTASAFATLTIQNGGVFNNSGAGASALSLSGSIGATYTLTSAGTTGSFNNTGTLNHDGFGVITEFVNGLAFNNTGTVNVNDGTMRVSGGGTSAGIFDIDNGKVFQVTGGTYTMDNGVRVNGAGNFEMTGGTTTFEGANGTSNGSLSVAGGTATFDTGATFSTAGKLTMTSGTLNGGGDASFGGASTFHGGTMSGSGTTIFSTGSTLSLANGTISQRTVENFGTASRTVAGHHGYFLQDGATFENKASGVFTVVGSGGANFTFNGNATTGTFVNEGAFNMNGTGTTLFTNGAVFNNNGGTVNANSSTLSFASGVTQHSGSTLTGGTWNVAAGATLEFATGSNITTIGSSASVMLTGAGSTFAKINTIATNQGGFTLRNNRDFTTSSAFANSGTVTVQDSATQLTIGAGGGSAYTQTAGETVLVGGALIDASVFNLNGGALKGTGTIASSVITSGSTTIAPGQSPGMLTIDGNLTLSAGNTLAMEIGGLTQGTLYDYLDVNGTLTLAGLLDLDFLNGFENSVQYANVFTLATADSAILGAFSNVASGSRLWTNTDKSFEVWYGAGSLYGANNLVITGAPEPSRAALMLLGLTGLMLRRNRTRK